MLYDVWKMEGAECEMESRSILFFPVTQLVGKVRKKMER